MSMTQEPAVERMSSTQSQPPSAPMEPSSRVSSSHDQVSERMISDTQFMNKATEENQVLLSQLDSSISRLSNLGSGMAGSIGVALSGTQITGLMPFGPAFQCGQLGVGDEVVSVDGVEVNDESVVGAVAGEQDTDLEMLVRKTTGEFTTVNLVRTSSAKLLIAHNLAQNLHAIFQRCSASVEMTCLDEGELQQHRSIDHELAPMVAGCVALLQELQDQLSRSETFIRARLKDVQSNMFLQLKQLQEQEQLFLQRYIMSMRTFKESFDNQISEAREAQDRAEEDRAHLLEQLGASEKVLNELQNQIQYQHVNNQVKAATSDGQQDGQSSSPPTGESNAFDEKEWLNERVQELQSRVDNLEAEKRIFQEMLHVDNPESIKQTLRAQNLIVNQLKEELQTSREHLTAKVAEVEELKKSLTAAEKEVSHFSKLCMDQDAAANQSRQTREKMIKDLEDSRAYSRALQDEVQRLAALSSSLQEQREKETPQQAPVSVLTELTEMREKAALLEKENEKLNSTISALQQRLVKSAQECEMLSREKDEAQAGLEKCKAELEELKSVYQLATEGWEGAKRELKDSLNDKRIILHTEPITQQATASPPPASTGSYATVRTEYSEPSPPQEFKEPPATLVTISAASKPNSTTSTPVNLSQESPGVQAHSPPAQKPVQPFSASTKSAPKPPPKRSVSPPPMNGPPIAISYSPSPWAQAAGYVQFGPPQPGPIITKIVKKDGAVYSSSNPAPMVAGHRQATSLPGSRSTSPAVPARSMSPMTPRSTVLYSSAENFPYPQPQPQSFAPMSPGPPMMSVVPTYVPQPQPMSPMMAMGPPVMRGPPVAARDRTAAWVQQMQQH